MLFLHLGSVSGSEKPRSAARADKLHLVTWLCPFRCFEVLGVVYENFGSAHRREAGGGFRGAPVLTTLLGPMTLVQMSLIHANAEESATNLQPSVTQTGERPVLLNLARRSEAGMVTAPSSAERKSQAQELEQELLQAVSVVKPGSKASSSAFVMAGANP